MESRNENIRRTVLVVEDEFVNSQLLGFILSEEYDVLYAQNGREALDVLNENRGDISMVLTDIKMPVMDGFTLISEMRSDEELGRIPVMVLTSESDYEEKSLDLVLCQRWRTALWAFPIFPVAAPDDLSVWIV